MDWKFLVKRKLSPLFDEFITQGQVKKVMKERVGANFGFDNYRAIEWRVAYSVKEIEEVNKIVKEIYLKQGAEFFKSLMSKWRIFVKELEKISSDISKRDYSKATDKKLIDELEKLKKAYKNLSTALYAPLIIEDLSEDIIKEKIKLHMPDKIEENFNILTSSEKGNEGIKELRSIFKMIMKLKEGKDITADVKKHIKEFGWINTRGFFGNAWSEEEVIERIMSVSKIDAKKRLNELNKHAEKVKKDTEKILLEIKADKGFRDFIDITKEYVYFRTHRMDLFVKSGFLARPLFKEISKRINLELEDFWYLFSDEIKQALLYKKDFSKVISERKKGFGFIRYKEKVVALTGKELEKHKKEYMEERINKTVTEIRGRMACAGKVKGIVKVISGKNELKKIKKGDILVTSMTTPDFVTAMEKAAAFVTDEGGILCHAAIVSREMKKPCIIGTKIATKVLKDGDLVEVDANKGIVRKVSREY